MAKSALRATGTALLLLLAALACGGDDAPLPPPAAPAATAEPTLAAAGLGYVPRPTVTLYPTFTVGPSPTPTATPEPTPTMAGVLDLPTPTPWPTPTLAPTPEPGEPTPEPTATPEPGGLYGALLGQTFFALHTPPEMGEPLPDWPEAEEVFLVRTTRFLMWYLLFDHTRIDESGVSACLLRITVSAGPPSQRREHVMHQEIIDVDIDLAADGDVTLVTLGLGDEVPGLWQPGDYKAEFWDPQDRVVATWEFKLG